VSYLETLSKYWLACLEIGFGLFSPSAPGRRPQAAGLATYAPPTLEAPLLVECACWCLAAIWRDVLEFEVSQSTPFAFLYCVRVFCVKRCVFGIQAN